MFKFMATMVQATVCIFVLLTAAILAPLPTAIVLVGYTVVQAAR